MERQMTEMEARAYLSATDFYFTADRVLQLTPEKKADLEAKREAAREVLRALQAKKGK